MALNGAVFLFWQMFRYKMGWLLRKIFGEAFVQYIRDIDAKKRS
jgi:hypothetical protein